jgi:two-component system sensor histidine kinase VanS
MAVCVAVRRILRPLPIVVNANLRKCLGMLAGNTHRPTTKVSASASASSLSIVKSITQAHDGNLTLTPRDAGGLCVTVQLPAEPPDTGR